MFKHYSESDLLKYFRWACIGEGITCVILYLVAMPLKYILNEPLIMIPAGIIHGLFFSFYLIVSPLVRKQLKWDDEDFVFVLLASLFPFATFWVEKKLMDADKNEQNWN